MPYVIDHTTGKTVFINGTIQDIEAGESSSLLKHQTRGKNILKTTSNVLNPIACTIVIIPTAFLNFLSQLHISLDEVGTFTELSTRIQDASGGELAMASITATCSFALNFSLMSVYLGPAFKNLITSFYCCKQNQRTNYKSTIIKLLVLNPWAFLNALIYAQIAKDTFAFSLPLAGFAFADNLTAYFATRVSAMDKFAGNPNKLPTEVQNVVNELTEFNPPQPTEIMVDMRNPNVKKRLNIALHEFLQEFNSQLGWEKQKSRICCRNAASWLWTPWQLFAGITSLPIGIVESIRGLESLSGADIGKSQNYHNVLSLLLGIIITLPTALFYAKSNTDMFLELKTILQDIYRYAKQHKYPAAILLTITTLIAIVAGYFSGYGLNLVASSLIEEGYLSYLGLTSTSLLGKMYPPVIALLTSFMNLSALLRLINTKVLDPKKLRAIDTMDKNAVLHLLLKNDPEINKEIGQQAEETMSIQDAPTFFKHSNRHTPRSFATTCSCTIL